MTHFPSKRLPRPAAVLAAVAPATSAGPWTDRAHGFASLAGGTVAGAGAGAGDQVVTVADRASLARYAAAEEPYVIRVEGAVAVEPFGSGIVVTSNRTIVGVGDSGEIGHGEPHLNPGTHNVIIRNPTIRDAYVEGDRDGRKTDVDAIRSGRTDAWGTASEPREFYAYRLDPAAAVPAPATRFSGPQKRLGAPPRLRTIH
ncbi:pectate lyase [Streptomyces rishiriensis]|uniref:Pectate lyase n=1 Tax=Streptomyces rishiriensis TaxID=68264 RepID=A0ABU0NM88_STRRH|nr:hypothetical protein [Streptomyces rishiriensis]MDQ0580215.1 pectate lyase [Streptomyces rishiriensis]